MLLEDDQPIRVERYLSLLSILCKEAQSLSFQRPRVSASVSWYLPLPLGPVFLVMSSNVFSIFLNSSTASKLLLYFAIILISADTHFFHSKRCICFLFFNMPVDIHSFLHYLYDFHSFFNFLGHMK